jgi:phospholipase C
MIVVSPWSKGGYVCSETFDHTSVIRFMETRFGVHEPNISPWRRAICGDLTGAFDFSHKDVKKVPLPDTDGYQPPDKDRHPDYVPTPPANPALPKQERGLRPARPLKYAATVDGSADTAAGKFTLTFASGRRPAPTSWSPPPTARTGPGVTPPRPASPSRTPGTRRTRTARTT